MFKIKRRSKHLKPFRTFWWNGATQFVTTPITFLTLPAIFQSPVFSRMTNISVFLSIHSSSWKFVGLDWIFVLSSSWGLGSREEIEMRRKFYFVLFRPTLIFTFLFCYTLTRLNQLCSGLGLRH